MMGAKEEVSEVYYKKQQTQHFHPGGQKPKVNGLILISVLTLTHNVTEHMYVNKLSYFNPEDLFQNLTK